MKSVSQPPNESVRLSRDSAFTLAEVMVATVVFAMSAIGLTSLFVQNLKYSTWQDNNVHITNSSFGIADQLKAMGANAMWKAYLAADSGSPLTLSIVTVDPANPNDGYTTVSLNVNQKDTATTTSGATAVTSVIANPNWNIVPLKLGGLATSPQLPVSYWVTIRRNVSAPNTVPAFDLLELTLIFRWSVGSNGRNTLNQIQITFPAPNCSFN